MLLVSGLLRIQSKILPNHEPSMGYKSVEVHVHVLYIHVIIEKCMYMFILYILLYLACALVYTCTCTVCTTDEKKVILWYTLKSPDVYIQ